MYISPQQFAQLLRNSTLGGEQQKAVLKILPFLSFDHIQKIAAALQNDVNIQQRIDAQTQNKLEKLFLEFQIRLDSVDFTSS
ncbi:hypothetical protein HYV56_00655 [Candidatus Peregrinibacteria bacterium]|nr:hypothetical protein [Candidatus Peregrinibacteria bacterium]